MPRVVDPGRGTDLLAFNGSEITAPVVLIGPHDQMNRSEISGDGDV